MEPGYKMAPGSQLIRGLVVALRGWGLFGMRMVWGSSPGLGCTNKLKMFWKCFGPPPIILLKHHRKCLLWPRWTLPCHMYTAHWSNKHLLYFLENADNSLSVLAFKHAASTASIRHVLKPPFSSSWMASIVVPPGEQTSSFNSDGCLPLSNTSLAEPWGWDKRNRDIYRKEIETSSSSRVHDT